MKMLPVEKELIFSHQAAKLTNMMETEWRLNPGRLQIGGDFF